MNKKILIYALSALIGASAPLYAKDKVTVIGKDKTPEKKDSCIQTSSPTATIEDAVNDTKVCTFMYSGKTAPREAEGVLDVVYGKAKKVSGKNIDKQRFTNWIINANGLNDKTIELVYNSNRGFHEKNSTNYFYVSENYEIAATSPTIENKSKSGWIKRVRAGIATLEDCTGWNAGVEFNKWGISYTRATKDYAPVSNPGSSTGNRFICDWNSTIKRDDIKENISLDVNLLQSKNKGATLFSGAVYSRFTKGINNQTMEQILDKKTGTVLSKDSNSLNQTKIEEAKQLELGLDLTVKKGFLNGFGIRAVEYFGEGGSTTFGGYLNYTYTLSK